MCIDASIAAKWVLEEPDSGLADSFLEDALRNKMRLAAPPHLLAEVTSAIYKRLRGGEISQEEALEGVDAIAAVSFDFPNPRGLYTKAVDLALEFNSKYPYDAMYLALGELLDCEVWTSDREFFDDAHVRYPRLRLLSEFTAT
jgi:predicted nucleic acid-binding protein